MPDYNISIRSLVQHAAVEFAVEEFEEVFDRLPDKIDVAVSAAATEAQQFWSEEAGRKLNTTRLRYQQSLYIYEDFTSSEGTVIGMHTEDKLVIAIEEGAPGFDLKPGFLKGGTRRVIPIPNPPKDMRVVTAGQGDDKWMHPGWPGLDLVGETDKQLDTVIIPKHLNKLFDSL